MPQRIQRLVGPMQLAAADALLYTAPANTRTRVTCVHIFSLVVGPTTVQMSIGADTAANRFFDFSFGNTISIFYPGFVLAAGETLRGHASAATTINLIISGIEYSLG